MPHRDALRVDTPLHTIAGAASTVGVPTTTLASWANLHVVPLVDDLFSTGALPAS